MTLKITPDHLGRAAIVYVRQSTMAQVTGNLESQRRSPTPRLPHRRGHHHRSRQFTIERTQSRGDIADAAKTAILAVPHWETPK
jgi:hypothetical protein